MPSRRRAAPAASASCARRSRSPRTRRAISPSRCANSARTGGSRAATTSCRSWSTASAASAVPTAHSSSAVRSTGSTLPAAVQVGLAIAMSGARLDLGQPELALAELEIPQLDPDRAFSYSPALFSAYAEVLDELGRTTEAEDWRARAARAEAALGGRRAASGRDVRDRGRRRRRRDAASEPRWSPIRSGAGGRRGRPGRRGRAEPARARLHGGRSRRTLSLRRPTTRRRARARGRRDPRRDGEARRARAAPTSRTSDPRDGRSSAIVATGATPLDGVDAVLRRSRRRRLRRDRTRSRTRSRASTVRRRERPVGYITNNASRSDASVAAHLAELGLDVAPRDVVTSPQAAMGCSRAGAGRAPSCSSSAARASRPSSSGAATA